MEAFIIYFKTRTRDSSLVLCVQLQSCLLSLLGNPPQDLPSKTLCTSYTPNSSCLLQVLKSQSTKLQVISMARVFLSLINMPCNHDFSLSSFSTGKFSWSEHHSRATCLCSFIVFKEFWKAHLLELLNVLT